MESYIPVDHVGVADKLSLNQDQMELVDKNVAMLSNYEVYALLSSSQQKTKGKKPNGRTQNLATITYETNEYLSKTPCALQDAKIIKDFLNSLIPFKLTKAEKLQLLNLRPVTQVELQLVIEEIEERLSDDQVTQLLEVVASLPVPETQEEEGENADEAGATEDMETS